MKDLAVSVILSVSVAGLPVAAKSDPAAQLEKDAAQHPSVSCSVLEDFKMQMHQAIYAALKYPAAVTFQTATGVTTVKYVFYGGKATDVVVSASSGNRMLDRAAVGAVKEAKYPEPPDALKDKPIYDVVYIIYDNTGVLQQEAKNREDATQYDTNGPEKQGCAKS